MEIEDDSQTVSEEQKISEIFGNGFKDKVEKLSNKTIPEEQCTPVFTDVQISSINAVEVAQVAKSLKNMKSSGVNDIPQCIVKGTELNLQQAYVLLFNLAMRKIPQVWKVNRVTPLLKKGDPRNTNNYCPISNLCSISKFL